MKSFCLIPLFKVTNDRMEKYLSNYISNMGLIYRTNKELMTTTATKARHQEKNIVKKWPTGLNGEFSKD